MPTLNPTYLDNVQSYDLYDKTGFGDVMTLVNDNPTILEERQLHMNVDLVENMLCDSYIMNLNMTPHVIKMRGGNMVV